MSLNIAVQKIKANGDMRLDRLHALGVSEEELYRALSEQGLAFKTKDYSGPGGLFDDSDSYDGDPSEIWLELYRPSNEDDD